MSSGRSSVEAMTALSAPILLVAVAGLLFPDAFHALVVGIGEWVAARVELP